MSSALWRLDSRRAWGNKINEKTTFRVASGQKRPTYINDKSSESELKFLNIDKKIYISVHKCTFVYKIKQISMVNGVG